KLIQLNDVTGEAEEVSIAIQGIIASCVLPPFELRSSRPNKAKQLAHARQSITITGLGSKSFDNIVQNCRHMYTMFIPEFISKYRDAGNGGAIESPALTASSCFFTPVKQASGFNVVSINPELDPHGILGKVDATKWVHTEDNKVGYYIQTSHADQNRQVDKAPKLNIGDIVEIQASMLSLPSKGTYTVKLILRSIVLLDGHLT
ncbi:hypothetical protein PLEOSDRAFT_1013960, partial [Pleurotus ostreatus PC15]